MLTKRQKTRQKPRKSRSTSGRQSTPPALTIEDRAQSRLFIAKAQKIEADRPRRGLSTSASVTLYAHFLLPRFGLGLAFSASSTSCRIASDWFGILGCWRRHCSTAASHSLLTASSSRFGCVGGRPIESCILFRSFADFYFHLYHICHIGNTVD